MLLSNKLSDNTQKHGKNILRIKSLIMNKFNFMKTYIVFIFPHFNFIETS